MNRPRADFDRFVTDSTDSLLRHPRPARLGLSGASRRNRRRRELIAAMPPDRGHQMSDGTALVQQDELLAALAALPARQRAVLVLRYFLDLPEAEVAAALNCSLGTVKSTASRGLARLERTMRPANDTRSIPT